MDKKQAEIELARQMMREGIEGEGDMLSRISTTMRKQARDRFKEGLKRYEKSDEKIREKEAYDFAGYKKGGKVKKMAAGGTAVPADLMNALSAQRALATPTSAPSIGRQASLMRTPPAPPAPNLPKNLSMSRRLATNDAPDMQSANKIKSPPPKVPENFSLVPKEPPPKDSSTSGYPPKKNYLMKSGGKVSSASKRADGCAVRGKTKGRMV